MDLAHWIWGIRIGPDREIKIVEEVAIVAFVLHPSREMLLGETEGLELHHLVG